MKKNLIFLTAAALLLTAGCTASAEAPSLSLPAETGLTLKTNSGDYQCTMTHLSDAVDTITIQSPAALKGLTFRQTNGEFAIVYGSLISRYETIHLPDDSLPCIVQELADYLRQNSEAITLKPETDGSYSCTGETSLCTFTLNTDSSGVMTTLTAAAKQ